MTKLNGSNKMMPLNDQLCGYKFSKRTLKYGYDIFKSFQPFLKKQEQQLQRIDRNCICSGNCCKKMEGDRKLIFEIEWDLQVLDILQCSAYHGFGIDQYVKTTGCARDCGPGSQPACVFRQKYQTEKYLLHHKVMLPHPV